MSPMKRTLAIAALLAILVAAPGLAHDGNIPKVAELSEQGARAIRRGLAWLAAHQNENGSWDANVGFKRNDDYIVESSGEVGHPGITALAGMAFLAGGNVPGRGKYGKNVEAAVAYLIRCVNADGMITANGTRMYSHAFGTLFLAEVYGMTRDSRVKPALEMATQFTFKCQNALGGWRYAPLDRDSDMSITVCQVMALRAARNIGIRVPKESIDRAVNYVLMSANTAPDQQEGSFQYQYRANEFVGNSRSTFALTAAGLATLFMAGIYSNDDILEHIREHGIARFLRRDPPPRIEKMLAYISETYPPRKNHFYFFYGNYYAVQAMFIAGGPEWEEYFRRVQDDLVRLQQKEDGSWPVLEIGDTFSTAVACIVLQVPYRYLPIFTR